MKWVSQVNIKAIMTAIRNKFTTGDLVIANDAKDTGVELNYTAQDGLVTVSPISTDASVESALHLSNGDDSKKTELTQGTLSYVTGSGDSEEYNYMSLLGDAVTFGKKGGGNVQVGGVADPTSAQQVATKNYVDNRGASLAYKDVTVHSDLTIKSGWFYETLLTNIFSMSGKVPICACIVSTGFPQYVPISFCITPSASGDTWWLSYIGHANEDTTMPKDTIIRIYYM